MKWNIRSHNADAAFPFLLLMVFGLFTLTLAALGSGIYQNGIEQLNENYTSRTAIAYLSEKVRQHDSSGAISLSSVEEIPAIAFCDTINDQEYITYVYCYDGAMRELFVRSDTIPTASLGTQIVELEGLSIENASADTELDSDSSPALLRVSTMSQEQNTLSLLIPIHCD
jgi:hypothetical protein